ncbi:MAG: CAAD domain-containing protein [Cyanobacteriota bacterium]|nr:CAAD domain-containing protein [Cyanobacteriota bacterium]
MVDTPGNPGGAEPTLGSSTLLPASPSASGPHPEEGGEWQILVDKLRAWLSSGQAAQIWHRTRSSLPGLGAILGVLLLLRVYGALLTALHSIPLLPGLLELVGVCWLLQHGAPRLIRSRDRQQLLDQFRQRWQAFRGA